MWNSIVETTRPIFRLTCGDQAWVIWRMLLLPRLYNTRKEIGQVYIGLHTNIIEKKIKPKFLRRKECKSPYLLLDISQKSKNLINVFFGHYQLQFCFKAYPKKTDICFKCFITGSWPCMQNVTLLFHTHKKHSPY